MSEIAIAPCDSTGASTSHPSPFHAPRESSSLQWGRFHQAYPVHELEQQQSRDVQGDTTYVYQQQAATRTVKNTVLQQREPRLSIGGIGFDRLIAKLVGQCSVEASLDQPRHENGGHRLLPTQMGIPSCSAPRSTPCRTCGDCLRPG